LTRGIGSIRRGLGDEKANMRLVTDRKEIEEIEGYMKLAAREAEKSMCKKSKRGVVIVANGRVIGAGYNKPTIEFLCCLRGDIKNNGQVELCTAIHAEQMAIIRTREKELLRDSRIYHIKVKNGEMRTCEKPSCTVCSRIVLESGIPQIVLYHDEGYVIYGAREFNKLSFDYFSK
jgi:dCMP deaminase